MERCNVANFVPVAAFTEGDANRMSDMIIRKSFRLLEIMKSTVIVDPKSKIPNKRRTETKCQVRQNYNNKQKENNTWDSNVVPHRSTNQARGCLTSLSRREAVLSSWYGRSHERMMIWNSCSYLPLLKPQAGVVLTRSLLKLTVKYVL